jgi:hypothetical protein
MTSRGRGAVTMLQTARAPLVCQASFFGDQTTTRDFDCSRARHLALDQRSWIEHIPNWLRDPDRLFADLMETAPWLQRDAGCTRVQSSSRA